MDSQKYLWISREFHGVGASLCGMQSNIVYTYFIYISIRIMHESVDKKLNLFQETNYHYYYYMQIEKI
jgi:hypothetical protein